MASQKTYCKVHCHFCGQCISSNGAAKASHFRTHVRKGEAMEIGVNHPEYRGQLEFVNPQQDSKLKHNKTFFKL